MATDRPYRGEGPPLSSTPERDAQWYASRDGKAPKPPGYDPMEVRVPFGIVAAMGLGGLVSSAIGRPRTLEELDADRRIEVFQLQMAQAQAFQEAFGRNLPPGLLGQVRYVQNQPTQWQAPEPEPIAEEPSVPRRRELDLEPAGEVAQPKVVAREIEL